MKYVLLLRGINVGGKNKVKMDELKQQLASLGCKNVVSYINSGNLIFDAEAGIRHAIEEMLGECYDFPIPFALISREDYVQAVGSLPRWWREPLFRRDALFFTDGVSRERAQERIGQMKLHDEQVHFTDIGIFWGKIHQQEYMKTAYHKQLGAEPLYKQVTIRNGNTVEKILTLLI